MKDGKNDTDRGNDRNLGLMPLSLPTSPPLVLVTELFGSRWGHAG